MRSLHLVSVVLECQLHAFCELSGLTDMRGCLGRDLVVWPIDLVLKRGSLVGGALCTSCNSLESVPPRVPLIAGVRGVVIVHKRKGSFCSSSFGWRSELLHVETARCYEPLQQRTKTAQTRSKERWDKIQ